MGIHERNLFKNFHFLLLSPSEQRRVSSCQSYLHYNRHPLVPQSWWALLCKFFEVLHYGLIIQGNLLCQIWRCHPVSQSKRYIWQDEGNEKESSSHCYKMPALFEDCLRPHLQSGIFPLPTVTQLLTGDWNFSNNYLCSQVVSWIIS